MTFNPCISFYTHQHDTRLHSAELLERICLSFCLWHAAIMLSSYSHQSLARSSSLTHGGPPAVCPWSPGHDELTWLSKVTSHSAQFSSFRRRCFTGLMTQPAVSLWTDPVPVELPESDTDWCDVKGSSWVHVLIRKEMNTVYFLRINTKLTVNMNWRYSRCWLQC